MSKPTCRTDSYGTKHWRLNGKRHREDGPAIEWANGEKQYWIHGEFIKEVSK